MPSIVTLSSKNQVVIPALNASVWIYHFEGSAAYGRAADSILLVRDLKA